MSDRRETERILRGRVAGLEEENARLTRAARHTAEIAETEELFSGTVSDPRTREYVEGRFG